MEFDGPKGDLHRYLPLPVWAMKGADRHEHHRPRAAEAFVVAQVLAVEARPLSLPERSAVSEFTG
jgi:hypothetical protein